MSFCFVETVKMILVYQLICAELTENYRRTRLLFQLFKNVLQLFRQGAFLHGVLALPGVF